MQVENQDAIIALLADPRTHGAGVRDVERVDTHISALFLAGDRVYKLKRAVRFPYLDFSTAARRRAACEAEVALNRRTAPMLYLGTVAVTRERSGALALDGTGEPVEWLVVMRRFDQDTLFDRMAERGLLTAPLMEALAEAIARFHKAAEVRRDAGGAAGLRRATEGNARSFAEAPAGVFDAAQVERLAAATGRALDAAAPLLDARAAEGFVRRCHGDLHLRNICLVDGRPTLFDALEFDEALASIDVLYDLAFLLMDLGYRRLEALAAITFNRYLEETEDHGGLAALPLFLSSRAAIRAHVTASTIETARGDKRAALAEAARGYLDLALRFLDPPKPRLVAVGGLSGTGKSTLARGLAPAIGPFPGAVVLRSDVIRKELAGVDRLTRLGAEGYGPAMTRRVYDMLRTRAAAILRAGHAVITDAVYARPEERAALEAAARDAGVPFIGLWLEAPVQALESRLAERTGDASDATVSVLQLQRGLDTGGIDWRRVDAGGPPEATLARARPLVADTRKD
jgi:aminoglycoside phosphotransferase family enzyme/predicted kinase